ncbi:TniQ family protein [Vreelandella titanicae]|uniref:TniQ family protein n=1 Tax=Vreelandella titanicae TaxID=664683 RepID=UPI0039BF2A4A
MKLLVRPRPFINESLESYMLRLSQENFFEYYQQLSRAIKDWLQLHDHEAAGAFPEELSRLNVYHAAQSSSRRIRALKLVESLTDNEKLPLLHLSVMHSSEKFCSRYASVFYAGSHLPRALVRQKEIPVCPDCLTEANYIRQEWHWMPYEACINHGKQMLHECPKCEEKLNYTHSECLHTCRCGFDLRNADTEPADEWQLIASRLAVGEHSPSRHPLLDIRPISLRLACLLWYQLYTYKKLDASDQVPTRTIEQAIEYFTHWPEVFTQELEQQAALSGDQLICDYNKTSFHDIFGHIVGISRLLLKPYPESDFVLAPLENFLARLVDQNPQTRVPNVADLLISMPEAAILLGTSYEQAYRLYEEGYLKCAVRLKSHEKLVNGIGVFYLREIMELRQSRMPIETGAYNNYLPAW